MYSMCNKIVWCCTRETLYLNLYLVKGEFMQGKEIKELIQKKRLHQWEVAEELKINEFTLSRWLRGEVSEEKAQKILEAITNLSKKL